MLAFDCIQAAEDEKNQKKDQPTKIPPSIQELAKKYKENVPSKSPKSKKTKSAPQEL